MSLDQDHSGTTEPRPAPPLQAARASAASQVVRNGRLGSLLRFCLPIGLALVTTLAWSDGTEPLPPEPPTVPLPAQTCLPCHGPAGNSDDGAIPSIAGLPRRYFIKTMRDYRQGVRFSTLMGRLAPAYSEAELWVMADYFNRQPRLLRHQPVDWDRVRTGQRLHQRYCRECHGDLDLPATPQAPILNGQNMDYLRRTLEDFQLGISQVDQKMAEALIRLIRHHGDEGIKTLIHYYGSARQPPETRPER